MCHITTHILDTSKGRPATGVSVSLSILQDKEWSILTEGVTNADGRTENLAASYTELKSGTYKLHFKSSSYLQANYDTVFYPFVDVVFNVEGGCEKYHIPLLMNPFGYSTYRGS